MIYGKDALGSIPTLYIPIQNEYIVDLTYQDQFLTEQYSSPTYNDLMTPIYTEATIINEQIQNWETLIYLQYQMCIPDYCLELAAIYYEKTFRLCPMEFDLMLTCIIIAYKFVSDGKVKNAVVESLIGYNAQALNSLEMHVLQLLDYTLYVPIN